MDSERWRRLEQLYHAALEQEPARRDSFLAGACREDTDLRREVESLLAQSGSTGALTDRSAWAGVGGIEGETRREWESGQILGPYKILRLLGEGGMGAVYEALDTRLNRKVAVKVCQERFSGRFEREARAISALNHPNICTLYDVGPNYLITELVEGETLDDWLLTGPGPERCLEVARQALEALGAAHRAGVVHRDLKPQNIMVRFDGYVKVLDFGLAKRMPAGAAELQSTATLDVSIPGQMLGTIAYMSPEQIQGEEVDQRSDLFAFGIILYEMLAGKHPWRRESSVDTLHAILHDDPAMEAIPQEIASVVRKLLRKNPAERFFSAEAVREALAASSVGRESSAAGRQEAEPLHETAQPLGKDFPLTVRLVIEKALANDPAERYQSMREMVVDLRRLTRLSPERIVSPKPRSKWISAAALFVVLLAAVAIWKFGRQHAGPLKIRSIAVLPLNNLSSDPEQEFFSDGVTEALISDLGRLHAFEKVISRTSVMRYKGTNKSLPQIGRELGVDAIVEGSVQRAGERLRVAAQLIKVSTDAQLWAREFDRDAADVLMLESDIARAIADEIQIRLTAQERAELARRRPVNPKAYEAYLKGRESWNKQTELGINKAIEQFKQSIEEDPNYAPAYAGLADSRFFLGWYGTVPAQDVWASTKAAAEKALRIDPALAEGHVSLGIVRAFYDWDWTSAEQELKSAVALNPGLADAHHWYAHYLEAVGRLNEALFEMQRAEELDPLSPVFGEDVTLTYYYRREYSQALAQSRKLEELEPTFWRSRADPGLIEEQTGKLQEAIVEFQNAITPSGNSPRMIARLAHAYAVAGRASEARRLLRDLEQQAGKSFFSPQDIGAIYAGLGENDRAFQWLQNAIAERSPRFSKMAKIDPHFDSLRSDPRFRDLLRKMGLSP